MEMDNKNQAPSSTLLPWVEPEISNLDVADTAAFPTTGADGEIQYPDCTRS
jgi:hypothetical protein